MTGIATGHTYIRLSHKNFVGLTRYRMAWHPASPHFETVIDR